MDIEEQRQNLIKEKELFEREQLAIKAEWTKEQENRRRALEEAQQKLEEERREMELEHEAQCKKLQEDWKKLEELQLEREKELRNREQDLQKKMQLLEEEREKYLMEVSFCFVGDLVLVLCILESFSNFHLHHFIYYFKGMPCINRFEKLN